MVEIFGTLISGTGTATNNLKTQLPLIAQEFPEIHVCHRGTINLQLHSDLFLVAPDHRTGSIHWNDAAFPKGEIIDLLRIKIQMPMDKPLVAAWLYVAHGSPHRSTPNVHEVVTVSLDIKFGEKCRLLIDRNCFKCPPFHPPYCRPGIYII